VACVGCNGCFLTLLDPLPRRQSRVAGSGEVDLDGEPVQVSTCLDVPREYDQDGNAVVVDEVVLLACGDERGVSRLEPAALSFGLEGRLAFQYDVDLVGGVSNWRVRRGSDTNKHAYFEVR
jgi:hypothetical protein